MQRAETAPSRATPRALATTFTFWKRAAWLAILASLFASASGCQEPAQYALLLEVRSARLMSELRVQVKQYHHDGTTTLYRELGHQLPEDEDGYLAHIDREPIKLRIIFDAPGDYAIHIVGAPVSGGGEVQVTSLCRTVEEVSLEDEVFLGVLASDNDIDIDGDTFPEDGDLFCQQQADAGIPCDRSCDTDSFNAMVDCNPDEEMVPPVDCGDVGSNEDWNPFATDHCGDCHDQDCWRGDATCADNDGDGYPQGVDCDDNDPAVNPLAEEICGNGINDNCVIENPRCIDGDVPCDNDGDGVPGVVVGMDGCGTDCDDDNPTISPNLPEGCGSDFENPDACPGCPPEAEAGIDENCNGRVDEGCFSDDLDDDGVVAAEDCNDCNAEIGPGRTDWCDDDVDQDCDGTAAVCADDDQDGDGFLATPIGNDCIDDDPHSFPGAPVHCGDGIAQNCITDVDCESITDEDGDGFAAETSDCDDRSAVINPWSEEICDELGRDEDCDGIVNEVAAIDTTTAGCIRESVSMPWHLVDFNSDIDHCGECRHRCCPGPCFCEGRECLDGLCSCTDGVTCRGDAIDYCCEGGCRDISSDVENCGSCGNQCLANETCRPTGDCGRGACSCPDEEEGRACSREPNIACCPGSGCVDLAIDAANCGECGLDCRADDGDGPRGDICAPTESGMARCFCGAVGTICTGTTWCTEVTEPEGESCGCADLDRDSNNCGACGNRCDANEHCANGRCHCGDDGPDCDGGDRSTCCPGFGCVDTDNDESHCGGCGQSCAWGEECRDGECRCGENPGCDGDREDCCAGMCRAVETDPEACGPVGTGVGCERRCEGQPCEDGRCVCPEGYDDCAGQCDCAVGIDQVCCDGECHDGECCEDRDCRATEGDVNPHCRWNHECFCRPEGEPCRDPKICCSDGCHPSC